MPPNWTVDSPYTSVIPCTVCRQARPTVTQIKIANQIPNDGRSPKRRPHLSMPKPLTDRVRYSPANAQISYVHYINYYLGSTLIANPLVVHRQTSPVSFCSCSCSIREYRLSSLPLRGRLSFFCEHELFYLHVAVLILLMSTASHSCRAGTRVASTVCGC